MRSCVKTHENKINQRAKHTRGLPLKSTLKRRPVIHDIPDDWSREQKIEQLLSIAEVLASRWRHLDRGLVTMDVDDIFQTTAIAIIKAVDDYDPAFETKLTTWALAQAKLAVRDAVRRNAHATRTMQERGQHVRWVSFNQVTQDGTGDPVSLEDLISETVYASGTDIIETLHRDWERQQLRDYLSRLTARERLVMEAYLQERSVSSIAEEIGVCDSRVYQIIESAISKMRGFERFENTKIKLRRFQTEKAYAALA
jgi:RNA polymerase sigma factor (sigma-70 family)